MLKHLLVGAVGLSSLALADGRPHHAGRDERPMPPVVTVPVVVPAPVPVVTTPAPLPAVVYGGQSMPYGSMPPPPPPMLHERGFDGRDGRTSDLADVREVYGLLSDFERAVAMRDGRTLRHLERRFDAFIGQELAECSRGRFDRSAGRLMDVQRRLAWLQGRVDFGAINQKRALYREVAGIAERDLRNEREAHGRDGRGRGFDRGERFGRR